LIETKTHSTLILLDEFDKVSSYKGNSAVHSCLNAVLDPAQNKEILDYYLDVKLDFSRVTFVITVNDQGEIPKYLLSRMSVVVELLGYTLEQKEKIAQQFIQAFFANKESLKNSLEITSEAFKTLINKTREKGVRQLKKGLDSIFEYCLLQWAEEVEKGETESKITVDSGLVHEIIPHDFTNIDLEDNPENKNEKKELESLRWELTNLRKEKNNQTELKVVRFNSLLVLRQVRGQFEEKEYQNYEGRINTAVSREEIEVVIKEFLLKAKQKDVPLKPIKEENRDKKIQDELAKIQGRNKDLEGKIKPLNDEIKKLKEKIQNLRGWGNQNEVLLTVAVIALVIWGVYGILKLLNFFRKTKNTRRK
jgi:hypothetical protein